MGPWIVALAVLGYLLSTVPLAEVERAVRDTSLPWFAAFTVLYTAATLVADSLATWVAFREALPVQSLGFAEVLDVRGASYLLAALNYGAGQGGLIYLLRRRHDIPLSVGTGAVLLASGALVAVISFAAGLGIWAGGLPADPRLTWLVLLLALGLPIYLAVLALRPAFFARRRLLAPLFDAGPGGTLRVGAARVVHLGILIAGNYVALRLFGIEVPATAALQRLPLVFLVGALPIAPAGLGTAQAAAVALLGPFADGATAGERDAAVLAYSLTFQVVGLAAQAAIGLAFLRRVGRRDAADGSVEA